jgi:hypothetical protein
MGMFRLRLEERQMAIAQPRLRGNLFRTIWQKASHELVEAVRGLGVVERRGISPRITGQGFSRFEAFQGFAGRKIFLLSHRAPRPRIRTDSEGRSIARDLVNAAAALGIA